MNVLRAIQVFSPTVSSALQLLKEYGEPRFQDVDASLSYIKNMYHFFEVHNVSTTRQYIKKLDRNIAPYIDIADERLQWLHVTFQNFIDDIQNTSASKNFRGLSKETAHALKFTAESTYLTVHFLLQEAGFLYVLTRAYSSDPVEMTFSHVRLRCGSNDVTDARAADYAIRQILRCGIVKASTSSNVRAEDTNFVSSAQLPSSSHSSENSNNEIPQSNMYSASVAFLSGYIIMKLQTILHCENCVSPLLSTTIPGPLLRLILLQDHGSLTCSEFRKHMWATHSSN